MREAHSSPLRLLLLFLITTTVLAGCGNHSSNSGQDSVAIQTFDYLAPSRESVLRVRRCILGRFKLRIATKRSWRFRIGGVLPVDEVGFVLLPGGGVVSVWLAASAKEAKRVALVANRRNRKVSIGTGQNDAVAHGRGITAIAIRPAARHPKDVEALYKCLE